MLRHILQYFIFAFTMFAAEAPAVGGDGGSGSSTDTSGGGGGSGETGRGTGGDGGAGAGNLGTPQGGPAQAGSGNQVDGFKQLRENYEKLKTEVEPWQKLNLKPDQVGQFQGVYQKVYSEAASVGRELGYPDAEIAEALAEDPVRTIDFLRNEAARMRQGGQGRDGEQDLADLVAQQVEQAFGPIQERENFRQTNEANALFERTVHGELATIFKAEGIDVAQIPEDEKFMILSAASEILKYNDDALKALKYEGKTAAVQQAVREAVNYLDKYYLARSGRDRARVQPAARPGQPAAQPGKQPSLEDMINDPSAIDAAAGRSGTQRRYL